MVVLGDRVTLWDNVLGKQLSGRSRSGPRMQPGRRLVMREAEGAFQRWGNRRVWGRAGGARGHSDTEVSSLHD